MKKTTLLLFTAFAIMASAVSCQKEQIKNNIPLEEQAKESALLSINICTPATKAQGSEHGNSANDAKINTLLTSSLKKYVYHNLLINNILYLCVT